MIVKLLTEHHLEFLSLKGGCRGLSESTHVKMSYCWKSHATAQMLFLRYIDLQKSQYGVKTAETILVMGLNLGKESLLKTGISFTWAYKINLNFNKEFQLLPIIGCLKSAP